VPVITGSHFLLYSTDPDADRAFFKDVLRFDAVDAGHGWLIFALPPSEMAVHPSSGSVSHAHAGANLAGLVLYLMCDDLDATMASLHAKKIRCGNVETAEWGTTTVVTLPSGARLGLYQPTHPTAIAQR